MFEAISAKPRVRGRSSLNTVIATINTLPAPVRIGIYTGVGLTVSAILGGCLPQSPAVTHEISECGGQTEVDIAQGSLERIKAKQGGEVDITVNGNGTITLNGMTMNVGPNEYFFGALSENHLALGIQGDVDGDGGINLSARSVCPVKPTPTPKPSPTPYSYLGKGSARLASLSDFHPDVRASKPVSVFRSRRG